MTSTPRRRRSASPRRVASGDGAARLMDFSADAETLARELLGMRLVRQADGRRISGRIVETEAYLGVVDEAAHSYNGRRTPRNDTMYHQGGVAYVYLIYGMHHCMNVVCRDAGDPQAVLIRAVEPVEGLDFMTPRRPAARRQVDLTSGPAKLAAAMDIDRRLDGADLITGDALWLETGEPVDSTEIARTPRIGIGYAGEWVDRPLRFAVATSSFVSGSKAALRAGRARSHFSAAADAAPDAASNGGTDAADGG